MEISIQKTIPPQCASIRGKSYDTRFLYVGFSRYDVEKKILSKIVKCANGKVQYTERQCDTSFSRGYHTEMVRVTLYSDSPRVWSEELSPECTYFFVQQPTQAVAT